MTSKTLHTLRTLSTLGLLMPALLVGCVDEDEFLFADEDSTELRAANPLPVHQWRGDGDPQDAIGGVHGTEFGDVEYSQGRHGQAFELDAGSDRISLGSAAAVLGTGGFSVTAWIKTTKNGGMIIQQRDIGAYEGQFIFLLSGSKLCYTDFAQAQGGYGMNFCGASSVDDGEWHHVAFVREDNGTGHLYVDAQLDGTSAGVVPRNLRAINMFIGADPCAPGESRQFAGAIDEVSIFDQALSPAEIAVDMGVPVTPVHEWRGDGDPQDAIGGVHGTLFGDVEYTQGRYGQAFEFDVGNDRISLGSAAAVLGTGGFSVTAWVKTTKDGGMIIQQRDIGAYEGQFIFRLSAHKLCYTDYAQAQGGYGMDFCGASSVDDGQWHHVAFVREDDGTGNLYVDAQLDGTSAGVVPRNLRAINMFIGADPCASGVDREFVGAIDEVSIFDQALSQFEIVMDMGS